MIVTVIVTILITDIEQLKSIFYVNKIKWYILAFGMAIAVWILDAFHLHSLCDGIYEKPKFMISFKNTMIGQFFNSLTPFSSGGQPAQVYYLSKGGIATGHAITILIVKSAMFQFVITLYSILSFILNYDFLINKIPNFIVYFLIGTVISSVVVLGYILVIVKHDTALRLADHILRLLSKIRLVKDYDKTKEKLKIEMDYFSEGISILRNNLKALSLAFLFQVAQLTILFLIPYVLYLAVESGGISLGDFLSAQAPLNVITAMIPSPGAAGGSEGISYLFFKNIFVTAPLAAVILLWRGFSFYINIIGGGLVYALMPDQKNIRHMKKQLKNK
jgi:uncharacterized protein (TIRG00374 family)